MVYMLHCGIKSPRATQRLVCNPGVVSKTLTCIYDCAAVNWFRIKLTNLRRHALRMNPGCTKPSTLPTIAVAAGLLGVARSPCSVDSFARKILHAGKTRE